MLKKTIKYTDYDGIEREEDFYFHLTKTELMEMETSVEGGLSAKLKQVVGSKSVTEIFNFCKELILKSYGIKSPDGKSFRKSKEISEEFSWTVPYDIIFTELTTNDVAASNFVKGILPADLAKELEGSAIPPQIANKH